MAVAPARFKPKRVFISYGHDEYIVLAKKLKEDLMVRGYDVWFDAERIKPGEDWERYIEEGLAWVSDNSKNNPFILLMTPHSVRRPDGFCLNELARAILFNLKIIPIMLVLCEPPLSICRIQWLDMQDCLPLDRHGDRYAKKFNMLTDAIEHDRLSFDGFHNLLLNALAPLSFDSEVRYNLERFTGREWVFNEIERWLDDPCSQRIFWITGSPGVGKTAIAAWLCAHWREVAAFHFCRHDNIQKIDPRRCIKSIAYQLSTQLPAYEERLMRINLGEIDDLNARAMFDLLIVQPLSANFPRPDRTVVILIDALDEATVDGKNEMASFIASEFERTPEWLRLIVTSRPDPEVMGLLQAYTPFPIGIDDLRNELDICKFLARELGKDSAQSIVKSIAGKCNGLFIYAEWVLRELKYKRLSLDHVDEFPQGLGGIYLKFFERQFPDIKTWESKVRPALEVLAASQEPIQLNMLSSIFGWNAHDERTFKKSLGSLFIIDKGTIQPFHKSIMEWLTNENKQDPYFVSVTEGHSIMADQLLRKYQSDVWNYQLLKYLPVHLCMAGWCKELKSILKDLKFIRFQWEKDKFNVLKQWTLIENRSSLRMVNLYRGMSGSLQTYDDKDLIVIASMLQKAFHYEEALEIFRYLIEYYRRMGELKQLQKATVSLALILLELCDYDDAMTMLKEHERICREIGDREELQRSLLKQANIYWRINEFDKSMELLKEQELICREFGNMDDLQESLYFQALIQRVRGNFKEAMALLKEEEHICRKTGNMHGLQYSLIDQGLILRAWGDLDGAMVLLKNQEELSRKMGIKENIIVSFCAQGVILRWRGDLDSALALFQEEEKLCHEFNFKYSLHQSLTDQAIIFRLKGDLESALTLLNKTKCICLDIGDKYGLQYAIGQEAIIKRLKRDLDGALTLHREEECICREIGHKRDLAISLSNQAIILRMKGDIMGALTLHNESEKMLRELGYKYGLQECLGEKAMTLHAKGDIDEALALLKEQERICRDMGLKLDLKKCLESLTSIIDDLKAFKKGEMEEKWPAYSTADKS